MYIYVIVYRIVISFVSMSLKKIKQISLLNVEQRKNDDCAAYKLATNSESETKVRNITV